MSQWCFTASTAEKYLLYLTWDGRRASKVPEPQPSVVCSTNASRFGCKCLTWRSSREEESRQCSSPVPNDTCRAAHLMLVSQRSCAVLFWSSEEGSLVRQGLPAGTRQCQSNVPHLQEHCCKGSKLTRKAKGRTSRYCPKKSHHAQVFSMIQDGGRCSMPKAYVSTQSLRYHLAVAVQLLYLYPHPG